jgi:hypothetical protein
LPGLGARKLIDRNFRQINLLINAPPVWETAYAYVPNLPHYPRTHQDQKTPRRHARARGVRLSA